MESIIREAIARIDVMQAGKSGSRGTGCLVGSGLVLTAFHVVANRNLDQPVSEAVYPGEITLTFDTLNFTTKATVHATCHDRTHDWVLLKCQEAPPMRPAPLAILEECEKRWESFGYPNVESCDGLTQTGRVISYNGKYQGCSPVLQLFGDQAAAGVGVDERGASGSPVFVEGSLVGHLRSVLPDAQDKTAAGTLYACPVVSVLEKCGDLLPIPDPILGLPGLPHQPLPDVPYRYLDRFTGEHAEVFFGRDGEIRQLYNTLTAANPPPLTLLYGQSGVGKSSFLEAGVVPRLQMHYETKYLRRDPQRSLLETLPQQTEPGKPLIVIFDQFEECAANELSEFLAAIKGLPHRIVLSFRKERLAEIQKQVSQAGIDSVPMLLKPLDHAAIVEIVKGLARTQRLDEKYHLTVDPDLPEMIAQLIVADRDSPVAPILEWLLSKLWERAKAANKDEPAMTVALYARLRSDGLAQAEFWDQQVKKVAATQAAAVDSGLALDVLTYFTTQLATAQRRSQADLLANYGHCTAQMPALVREMEAHFLLCDASTDGEKASRLIHDTLAPLVLGRSDRSIKLGQRARRIIESHTGTWDHTEDNALDGGSLAVVEGGLAGMRESEPAGARTARSQPVQACERSAGQPSAEKSQDARLRCDYGAGDCLHLGLDTRLPTETDRGVATPSG